MAEYIGSVLSTDYEVAYAADGSEGLAKAEELVPDVILTDVTMPTMDGLELCRRLRANLITSHIPVIVVTARVTDDDRLRGIEAGADAYLTKPFRSDELLLRIAKIMEQRQRLREKWSTATLPGETAEVPTTDIAAPTPDAEPTPSAEPAALATETADSPSRYVSLRTQRDRDTFVATVDEIIARQMGEGKIGATAIASELCMSLSQFSRKLNAVTGLSPTNYITRRRMEEACRMLEETPMLVSEIASRCGYADLAHFSHAFRRIYGISPSQYINEKIKPAPNGSENAKPAPDGSENAKPAPNGSESAEKEGA